MALGGMIIAGTAEAQNRVGTGAVADLYRQHCAICHGRELQGGLGGSLIAPQLVHGDDDESLLKAIAEGFPTAGMQGFAGQLDDKSLRSLVIYIKEIRQQTMPAPLPKEMGERSYSSQHHDYRLEQLLETDGEIWSLAFLPDETLLFTEKEGRLKHRGADGRVETIRGIPEVWVNGQGGLLAVTPHPQYSDNGWIYLGYSARLGSGDGGMTYIARGKIADGKWSDHEVIWQAPDKDHSGGRVHFGTRIVFHEGYLFFSVGDRGQQTNAQDLSNPMGALHRIHDDGRIPQDNPFVDRKGAQPSIWSYGHRNQQGMAVHPATKVLWTTEHGPRGGDELNRIQRGLNYGWPEVTHGMNYSGTPITPLTSKPDMESPVHHWTPSIAVCGIAFYNGTEFPNWRNDLFVTGLASEQLHRLRIEDNKVVEEEILLKGHGRLRDVISGPDGKLYLAVNLSGSERGKSRIVRMDPAQ